MFGKKPGPPTKPDAPAQIDHGLAEYEYVALTFTLAEKWNIEVNKYARQGWELVNGDREGVAIYAFMRRKIRREAEAE